jgi:hypothetical protein
MGKLSIMTIECIEQQIFFTTKQQMKSYMRGLSLIISNSILNSFNHCGPGPQQEPQQDILIDFH